MTFPSLSLQAGLWCCHLASIMARNKHHRRAIHSPCLTHLFQDDRAGFQRVRVWSSGLGGDRGVPACPRSPLAARAAPALAPPRAAGEACRPRPSPPIGCRRTGEWRAVLAIGCGRDWPRAGPQQGSHVRRRARPCHRPGPCHRSSPQPCQRPGHCPVPFARCPRQLPSCCPLHLSRMSPVTCLPLARCHHHLLALSTLPAAPVPCLLRLSPAHPCLLLGKYHRRLKPRCGCHSSWDIPPALSFITSPVRV